MSEAHGAGEEVQDCREEQTVPPQPPEESNAEKLKKLNRGLLRAVSVNTHSFSGLDDQADDWVDLRLGFEERCEAWRRHVPLPSASEVSQLAESGFERDWDSESHQASSSPAPIHSVLARGGGSEDSAASDAASAAHDGHVAARASSDDRDQGDVGSERSSPEAEDGQRETEEEVTPTAKGKGRAHTPTSSRRLTIRLPPSHDLYKSKLRKVSHPAPSRRAAPSTPVRRKPARKVDCNERMELKIPEESGPAKKKARTSSGQPEARFEFPEPSSDAEDPELAEFEESLNSRKRGRPYGSTGKKGALAGIKALESFSIPAFIEVTLPAQVVKPTTTRGSEKLVQPPPVQLGPIQINSSTTWEKLLVDAAHAVMVDKENLVVTSMRWSWVATSPKGKSLKTTRWFPLHDVISFRVFMDMLTKTAASGSLGGDELIVISMAQPKTVQRHDNLPWLQANSRLGDASTPSQFGGTSASFYTSFGRAPSNGLPAMSQGMPLPGAPAATPARARSSGRTVSVDEDIAELVDRLVQLHGQANGCGMHPGMQCFYYAPMDWHFELTDTRLKAWAGAILKRYPGVDEYTPPIGREGFTYADSNKSRAPQILGQAQAGPGYVTAHAVQPNVGPGPSFEVAYAAPQMIPTTGMFSGYTSPQFAVHAMPPATPFHTGAPSQGTIYPGMYGYPTTPVAAPLPGFVPHGSVRPRTQSGPFTYNPHLSFPSRRS